MTIKIMKRIFMLALVLAIFTAGCSKPPVKVEKKGENLSPKNVADQIFEAFRYRETDDIGIYFSKEITQESVKEFAEAVKSEIAIDKFRTRVSEENDQTAKVKIVYRYIDLKQPQESKESVVKNIGEKEFLLKKEDGFWKIRRTGFDKELDEGVEEKIFIKCLSAVLDITIAQEKYKLGKEYYSQTLGLLDKSYIRESECSEMKIERANRKGYLASAKSNNFLPCEIIATTECHAPKSFSECAGKKYLNDCMAEEDVPPVKLATPVMATSTQPIPSKENSSVTIAKISKSTAETAKKAKAENPAAAPGIAGNSEIPSKDNTATSDNKTVEKIDGTGNNTAQKNQPAPVKSVKP